MSLSFERIFTDPRLFGVKTATAVQRAKCRIVAGMPLGDLANDPTVIEALGGVDAIAALPDHRPVEMLDISAIRVGKSLWAAAFIVWLSQTVDLSGTISSDIVRIFVAALKLEGTAAVMKHLVENLLNKPALRSLLADDPKDVTLANAIRGGLRLKHPSHKIIEVKCIPLDRAGGSGLSVYCAGVVVDEYPRMIGADDGVKNVEHFRDGVIGRLLPGAVYLATGSPWQPYGPAYDAVVKHFGKPTQDLVVMRTSAAPFIGINPEWTTKKAAFLERRNPRAYKTDYLAQFTDGEETVFPPKTIEAACEWVPPTNVEYGKPAIFADPSALRHDTWAALVGGWVYPQVTQEDLFEHTILGDRVTEAPPGQHGPVIVGKYGWIRLHLDDRGQLIPKPAAFAQKPWFEVFKIVSWDKKSGARGLDLVKAIGDLGREYGCSDFHWDGYEQLMLGDAIRREGLRPHVHPWSQGKKTQAVDHLRTLFIERRVKLPKNETGSEMTPQDKLKQELVRFRARQTPGGNFQYIVTGGEGHGDHASCLLIAMRADLDGFVDRSPSGQPATKYEILDHVESDDDSF
jgi:hypothetical protein